MGMLNDLTDQEREIVATLPQPPEMAEIHVSNVWIVEWLPTNEPHTGRTLHDWMNERRPGWSACFPCQSKSDVLAAINRATMHTRKSGMHPVLHIEAHGGKAGLEGPGRNGNFELLTWDELIEPLQKLNLATRCNLLVVVAACIGFAGVKALVRGPRAPAIALVGPDADIMPRNLLWGTKEFYRRWLDEKPSLSEIAESASREAGTISFLIEPFTILSYEALVESLIKSTRTDESIERKEKIRQRLLSETNLSSSEIANRVANMPALPPWECIQQSWDEMFMIDIEPKNKERFGLDLKTVIERISSRINQ